MSLLTKTFKAGGINLDVNKSQDKEHLSYVPQAKSTEEFIDTKDGTLEKIALGIKKDMPVLIIGETGTGKTSAVRYLASKTNNAFRRLNLNGSTTVDELLGKTLINKDGTYWIDGVLIDAMRKGHWILLDEINASLPEVLFALQSLLDDDRFIVLAEKDGEIVRPHPDFRVFASMNPTESYAGTKDLNKALQSRFPLVLEVDFPKQSEEIKIVQSRISGMLAKDIKEVVEFGNTLRETFKKKEMDFVFSTRELLNWLNVNAYFNDMHKSAEVTILGKCNPEDREVVADLIKLTFAKTNNTPEEALPTLKIGDKVVFTKNHKHTAINLDELPKGAVLKIQYIDKTSSSKPQYHCELESGQIKVNGNYITAGNKDIISANLEDYPIRKV